MLPEKKIPGTLNRITARAEHLSENSDDPFPNTDVHPAPLAESNVVTSMLGGEWHAPVLDLDIPHALVPSSTPGHSHLYLDVPMTWKQYKLLLGALRDVGIIQEGYYQASLARGHSDVRLPWVKKEKA